MKTVVIHKRIRRLLKLKATTMVELLVVMIISGIVFLLVFEGVHILDKYNKRIKRSFYENTDLLLSHQFLEASFDETDSIKCEKSNFYLISRGLLFRTLRFEKDHLILSSDKIQDTLFRNLIKIDTSRTHLGYIDSLFLSVKTGTDTVTLEYGLPNSVSFY